MQIPDKTIAELGWGKLLDELAKRAQTPRGTELARTLPLYDDIDAARARLDEIGEARALRDRGEALPLFGPDWGVRNIDEPLQRSAKSGALDPQSLRDVAQTLIAGARVRQHLVRQGSAPRLLGRAALISDLDDVSSAITDAFEDGQGTVRLRDRASPALGGLRRNALRIREELERKLERLLDATHLSPHLQDRFFTQREDRYVVPIRVDARSQVRGIVHGTSQSGQTVFVEPEDLVDLNNRLKLAELEVAEEERRILAALSLLVAEAMTQIQVNIEVLSVLDLIDAGARLAGDLRATPPELLALDDKSVRIDLRRARHPLMVLAELAHEKPRTIVANDIVLTVGQTLVVSGPNAGGKTVALKLTGLIVLMARAGMHIPAQEGSSVPWLDAVVSDIGDDQSIERDLSTFSAHVLSLKSFLSGAHRGQLVLLDEVAAGTDPAEGAALAQAVLEALADGGATVIVTTHYDRLKALPTADARFVNASVGFDMEKLLPTYQLHLGIPGASGAIRVAQRLGVDGKICARATELAGSGQASLEQLLMDLEAERQRIAGERAATVEARRDAERAHEAAAASAQRAKEKLEDARRGAHDEAVETLRRARAELDATATVLKRAGGKVTPANVTEAKQKIAEAARAVHAGAPQPEPPPGRAATVEDLKPGVEVWVQRLNGRASVLALKGKQVSVQAGLLKVNVPVEELRIPSGPASQKSARSKRGHNAFEVAAPPKEERVVQRGGYNTIDVRGERVDAAVGLAEKFLDDALRTGQEAVFVIHGHGTGALRESLRVQLTRFPGVATVRPATPEEGGDGVTVITLS